jgi:hypothetical protein
MVVPTDLKSYILSDGDEWQHTDETGEWYWFNCLDRDRRNILETRAQPEFEGR